MAHCPKCRGDLAQTATICPNCGYDFPPAKEPTDDAAKGLLYCRAASVILILGYTLAALLALLVAVGALLAVCTGQWLNAAQLSAAAVLLAAQFVALGRIADRG